MSKGMIYILYVGHHTDTLQHLSAVCPGMLIPLRTLQEASLRIAGMRERYDTMLLVEQTRAEEQCQALAELHKRFPRIYILLISAVAPTGEERKNYLQAGVSNLITPDVTAQRMKELEDFLNQRKLYKLQEFKEKHQNDLTHPFHLPLWKRCFDIVVSAGALLVLSPLLIGTAIAIRLESKGPIIYRSKRVGTNYQVFDFLKFRSMYTNADRRLKELSALNQYAVHSQPVAQTTPLEMPQLTGDETDGTLLIGDDFVISEEEYTQQQRAKQANAFVKIEGDPRVTRVGRFIRKYSIDELPQLINILKGDMSVVGNRPLPLYEAEQLTNDDDIERFLGPAGLTGLWQVEKRGGAGAMSAAERKQLDVRYAHEFSFAMDFKIILRTFTAFIQKENV